MLVPSITLTMDDETSGTVQRPLSLMSSSTSTSSDDPEELSSTMSSSTEEQEQEQEQKREQDRSVDRSSWLTRVSTYSTDTWRDSGRASRATIDSLGLESIQKCIEMYDFPTLPPWPQYQEPRGFRSQR